MCHLASTWVYRDPLNCFERQPIPGIGDLEVAVDVADPYDPHLAELLEEVQGIHVGNHPGKNGSPSQPTMKGMVAMDQHFLAASPTKQRLVRDVRQANTQHKMMNIDWNRPMSESMRNLGKAWRIDARRYDASAKCMRTDATPLRVDAASLQNRCDSM